MAIFAIVSAPKFVPNGNTKVHHCPPQRKGDWLANRAGETLGTFAAEGAAMLGSQGPDQGYAIGLAKFFVDKLHTGSVDPNDAIAGCLAVAMKRASIFGRAPVVHDLQASFCLYGFLHSSVNPWLVRLREEVFAGVGHNIHYIERRYVADLVSETFLSQPIKVIEAEAAKDWKVAFSQDLLKPHSN